MTSKGRIWSMVSALALGVLTGLVPGGPAPRAAAQTPAPAPRS